MKILQNKIRCKRCGDVIESTSVHDFVTCSCGACSVDGGHNYLRRCFPADSSPEEVYEDLSVRRIEEASTTTIYGDTKITQTKDGLELSVSGHERNK